MADKSKIVENGKGKLLNIFTEEKDKKGTDLLAMSNSYYCSFMRRGYKLATVVADKT